MDRRSLIFISICKKGIFYKNGIYKESLVRRENIWLNKYSFILGGIA